MQKLTSLESSPATFLIIAQPKQTVSVSLMIPPSRFKKLLRPVLSIEILERSILRAMMWCNTAPIRDLGKERDKLRFVGKPHIAGSGHRIGCPSFFGGRWRSAVWLGHTNKKKLTFSSICVIRDVHRRWEFEAPQY